MSIPKSKKEIVEYFSDLCCSHSNGFEAWLSENGDDDVFSHLATLGTTQLSHAQFNQLLNISKQKQLGVSSDFFRYYWLSNAPNHSYDVEKIQGFERYFVEQTSIVSFEHLKWGLRRIYIDALLHFGNITRGFYALKDMNEFALATFFAQQRFDTEAMKARGPHLPFETIKQDDRHLISEFASKTHGDDQNAKEKLKAELNKNLELAKAASVKNITTRYLINHDRKEQIPDDQLSLSFGDVLDETIESQKDIDQKIDSLVERYYAARDAAKKNTRLYLSLVNELDIYVATSMRNRDNFRQMAENCENIFNDPELTHLHLRYFDPTLSVADGHEDKGLIECLMVKCCKVLIYSQGDKDSWGKDAEAAMALSLGKPVIFLGEDAKRIKIAKDVHPLSRLINFSTGVAVGVIATDSIKQVSELIYRIFENKMEYDVEQVKDKPGYFRLHERLTGSVVRIQTNDNLISKSFWNYYDKKFQLSENLL